jgi:hypothetical protein
MIHAIIALPFFDSFLNTILEKEDLKLGQIYLAFIFKCSIMLCFLSIFHDNTRPKCMRKGLEFPTSKNDQKLKMKAKHSAQFCPFLSNLKNETI